MIIEWDFDSKMKNKVDNGEAMHMTKLSKYVLFGSIVFLGLICLYYGSAFAPGLPRANDVGGTEDGTDPVFGGFVPKVNDIEDLLEDQENNPEVPKSIPVRNDRILVRVFLLVCFVKWLSEPAGCCFADVWYEVVGTHTLFGQESHLSIEAEA